MFRWTNRPFGDWFSGQTRREAHPDATGSQGGAFEIGHYSANGQPSGCPFVFLHEFYMRVRKK